ncbi:MAG TPA: hypothetical protein VN848_07710 [Gemmatimonadales bacterium]|nr:hypothetical protein [Gemmatimonadales bacterium]
MGQSFWDQAGWAVGVGIVILAVSLRKALPHVAHALADRIAGRTQPAARSEPEAFEDLARRLTELEERVDFAERLLAKPGAERKPSA